MSKILLVEDDCALAEAIQACLQAYHHEIQHVVDGQEALDFIATFHFDLVILDWDLPKVSGVEICRRIKASGKAIPTLMLTGRASMDDKAEGFDAGADDYLTKPFQKRELAARVKALTRRWESQVEDSVVFGDLALNLSAHEVYKDGTPIDLSNKERQLLAILIKHRDNVVSTTTILNSGWSAGGDSDSGLAPTIARLKAKLKSAGSAVAIETCAGTGFLLRQSDTLKAGAPVTPAE